MVVVELANLLQKAIPWHKFLSSALPIAGLKSLTHIFSSPKLIHENLDQVLEREFCEFLFS
jgi:hypothetical protein